MECRSCQASLAPDAAFCHRCGQPSQAGSAPAGPEPQQNPRFQDGVWRWTAADGHELLWHPGFQKWLPAGVYPMGDWRRFQSLRIPGLITVALLVVALVFVVMGIAASVDELWLVHKLDTGNFVSLDRVDANERFAEWVAVFWVLSILAVAPFFIWWLYRANTNLVAFGALKQRYANGWAIGAWFIPVFNLWRPVQMVRQAWRGSDDEVSPRDPPDWRARPVAGLVMTWWLFWVLAWVVSSFSNSVANSAETLSALKTALFVHVILSTGEVVTVVLAIAVVLALTRRQERAASRWGVLRAGAEPHASLRDPAWPRQNPGGIPANPRWQP